MALTEVEQLRADLAEALKERDQARAEIPYFDQLTNEGGELSLRIKAGPAWAEGVAAAMMTMLNDLGGPNYVQMDMHRRGEPHPYRMIMVRPEGKSPRELQLDAERERDEALVGLREWRETSDVHLAAAEAFRTVVDAATAYAASVEGVRPHNLTSEERALIAAVAALPAV